MKTFVVIILMVLLASFNSMAQFRNANWVFGDSAGITFINGTPTPLNNTSINSFEPSASISNYGGNLLFYIGASSFTSYCSSIWNYNNQIILNGDSILSLFTITQGALIIPFTNDSNKYYVFTICWKPGTDIGLCMNIIDVNQNNGNGSVLSKNIIVYITTNDITEKMVAVKHGNGRDWWILVHDYNSDQFVKVLIENDTIKPPVFQSIGNVLNNQNITGQMSIAPYGDKLVVAGYNGILDYYKFDRCTGLLYDWVDLGNPPYNYLESYYGSSFAPNKLVLYASNHDSLFQFDLNAPNIKASKMLVWFDNNGSACMGQHQIGLDNKIYIASARGTNGGACAFPNNIFDSTNMFLSVIDNPDILGLACNVLPYSVWLGGRRCYAGLPNMPNYNLGVLQGSICDTLGLNLNPNPSPLGEGELYIAYEATSEKLFIKPQNLKGKHVTITIYDGRGSAIINYELKIINGYATLDVDCSGWSDGLYVVHLQTEMEALNKKFTKK